jgi:hypothetical protein
VCLVGSAWLDLLMRIFLSYRRADTQDAVGRLADKLRATPGVSKVFMDVEEIDRGQNFMQAIDKAMRRSRVRLVVIGREWTKLAGADGAPRILNPSDTVAAEVRAALAGNARVIPVLVNGATMPCEAEIPADLAPLTKLNAAPLRHDTFDSDFVLLTNAIFNRRHARGVGAYLERHPFQAGLLRGMIGLVASAILLISALLALRELGIVQGALGGSREAAIFIAGAVLLVGTFAPVFLGGAKRRRAL